MKERIDIGCCHSRKRSEAIVVVGLLVGLSSVPILK